MYKVGLFCFFAKFFYYFLHKNGKHYLYLILYLHHLYILLVDNDNEANITADIAFISNSCSKLNLSLNPFFILHLKMFDFQVLPFD